MSWDETKPTTTTKVKDSPSIFQGNWVALDAAIDEEHEGMEDTTPGAHQPGECGVLFVGATADVAALTPPACAIAYDTSLSAAKYYSGAAWTTLAIDHGHFSNMASGDPHTQYLNLNKANQIINASISLTGSIALTGTVDGVDISDHASGAAGTVHTAGLGTIIGTPVTKLIDTIYQASTDGLLVFMIILPIGGVTVQVLSDAATPPTIVVAQDSQTYTSITTRTLTVPIRKDDYYKATAPGAGAATIYFYPIGS